MKLTEEMIDDFPAMDLHVHVPGTISAATAWQLGINNDYIRVNGATWANGEKDLHEKNPHEYYSDIFDKDSIRLDTEGKLLPGIRYAIEPGRFKSFDHIMATVQGHRNPPGGICTPEDYKLVCREYLKSCVSQNIFYTELQQNIVIAHKVLYPHLKPKEARKKFFLLLKEVQQEFLANGVHVRFLNCFNKTAAADDARTAKERSLEAADWLIESREVAPGVFVGMQSAGHEKDETGWPIHLLPGYNKAKNKGFGCEAHGGEGIGVKHMMDVIHTLPITRLAHGFQVIEDELAIEHLKNSGVTLLMSPCINIALGSPIHMSRGVPTAGGEQEFITSLGQHPFFTLLRDHKVKIALATDNPDMGGEAFKPMIKHLAGLTSHHDLGKHKPFTANELVECALNSAECAFCSPKVRKDYVKKVQHWMKKHKITNVEHDLLSSPAVMREKLKQAGYSAENKDTPSL